MERCKKLHSLFYQRLAGAYQKLEKFEKAGEALDQAAQALINHSSQLSTRDKDKITSDCNSRKKANKKMLLEKSIAEIGKSCASEGRIEDTLMPSRHPNIEGFSGLIQVKHSNEQ